MGIFRKYLKWQKIWIGVVRRRRECRKEG